MNLLLDTPDLVFSEIIQHLYYNDVATLLQTSFSVRSQVLACLRSLRIDPNAVWKNYTCFQDSTEPTKGKQGLRLPPISTISLFPGLPCDAPYMGTLEDLLQINPKLLRKGERHSFLCLSSQPVTVDWDPIESDNFPLLKEWLLDYVLEHEECNLELIFIEEKPFAVPYLHHLWRYRRFVISNDYVETNLNANLAACRCPSSLLCRNVHQKVHLWEWITFMTNREIIKDDPILYNGEFEPTDYNNEETWTLRYLCNGYNRQYKVLSNQLREQVDKRQKRIWERVLQPHTVTYEFGPSPVGNSLYGAPNIYQLHGNPHASITMISRINLH